MKRYLTCLMIYFFVIPTFAVDWDKYYKITNIKTTAYLIAMVKDIPRKKNVCSNIDLMSYAVANQCEKNSHKFYDVAEINEKEIYGWCYESESRLGLGVSFEIGKNNLIISSLNNKSGSLLQKKDKIISINEVEVADIGELKQAIWDRKNSSFVNLVVLRSGRSINLKEPLMQTPNALVKDKWAIQSACMENMPIELRD